MTDHLKQFGAIEIPARDYMTLLAEALDMQATFYGEPDGVEGFDGKIGETLEALFRQSKTQTS